MFRFAALGFAFVLAAMTLGGVGAIAQTTVDRSDLQSLINRIDRLQRELNTLQRQVYRGGPPPAASPGVAAEPQLVAGMQVRLDEIETKMRSVTGRLEELQHAIDVVRKQVGKLASDVDFRLKALEARSASTPGPAQAGAPVAAGAAATGGAGTPPAAAPALSPAPPSAGVLGTISINDLERQKSGKAAAPTRPLPTAKPVPAQQAALPKGTPEDQYKYAQDLLFRADFGAAERAFAAFVSRHPKHQLAGNAQYWLGETHYARGAFRTAAAVFAEGYQKYPTSAKAADNLLKLGMSLAAIDKNESACTTFTRLLKEFPKASPSVLSRARAQRKKLRCR
ncbi:MAG: tol-pal system protein YbgF [Alphaproteobacteria bacterium]|nr:tol-pal system protein YbgF [Alphaproteobacteria bacterium]